MLVVPLPEKLPELGTLIQEVSQAKLSELNIPRARLVCEQICKNWQEIFRTYQPAMEVVPGVMDRIILYQDEFVDIRAHLFHDVTETYVHNHGNDFISTCLQGGYKHRLWAVERKEEGSYLQYKRTPGGSLLYDAGSNQPAALSNVLCQPFQAGKSLFISARAYHTVGVDQPGQQVSTLIVKAVGEKQPTSVLLNKAEDGQLEPQKQSATDEMREKIAARMTTACDNFTRVRLNNETSSPSECFFTIGDRAALHELQRDVTFLTQSESFAHARELAAGVAVYMINWALPDKIEQIDDICRVQVVTWLETLLSRQFATHELDLFNPKFSGSWEKRKDFLRICCSVNTQRNGWEFARRVMASTEPRAVVASCPDKATWESELQQRALELTSEKGKKGEFLFRWASVHCLALSELGEWILNSINAKMEQKNIQITPLKKESNKRPRTPKT